MEIPVQAPMMGTSVCGSAERRPTNNCRDHGLVGRDSVEPGGNRRRDHSNQRSLPKIIALCHPEPRMLSGRGAPQSRIDVQRSLCVSRACWRGPSLALGMTPKKQRQLQLPRLSVDQFRELLEKVTCVVRSGRGLRMILHTKNR